MLEARDFTDAFKQSEYTVHIFALIKYTSSMQHLQYEYRATKWKLQTSNV